MSIFTRKRVLDGGQLAAHDAPLGDKNLLPMHVRNRGTSIIYYECAIHLYYPASRFVIGSPNFIQPTPTEWKVVTCKPGQVVTLPHRYYTRNTRDNTPIREERVYGIEHLDPIGRIMTRDF